MAGRGAGPARLLSGLELELRRVGGCRKGRAGEEKREESEGEEGSGGGEVHIWVGIR